MIVVVRDGEDVVMANVSVSYGDLDTAVSDLRNGHDTLVSELNTLKSKIDALVSGGFVTDRASGAFQQSYEEFTKGATQTVDGLNGMEDFLNKTKQSMTDLDTQLASSLQ
ncbi:WXG100 family type VII secretion target [Bifidobacterium sp. B4001]|nr:WXG100 family type VII secretion target [Bifidobacterium sp. B4079]MCX8681180.1 WXG100 family type VII secretion target [Bifidobacterium sp. B4001]